VRKVLIGVIAGLVLLYPAMVWLIGFSIEKRFDESSAQVSERAPYVTVVEQHFHRGWYSSQHEATLEFGAAGAAPPPFAAFRITVRSVIHHGPICGLNCFGLARVDTRLEFTGQPQLALVNIRSRLGFFGGGSSTVSSPAVKDVTLTDGAHVSWGGAAATSSYGAHYDSYGIHLTLPHAAYSRVNGEGLEVTAAAFDTHSMRALRSLYLGDSSLDLGRLAFARAGGTASFSMSGAHSESHSSASQGYMTLSTKNGTGAIVMAPVTLSGVHFDFTFRHLDMESLERLSAALRDTNAGAASAPADRSGKIFAVLKQQGAALLLHQPQIAIDRVSIANADGEALLTGSVQLSDVAPTDFAAGADPAAVMQKLDVDLDLTFDDAMLKNLPGTGETAVARIQVLADQGLVTRENGKVHTKILFHHGRTTFNGKTFRPPGIPATPSQ
jgi:uncharacterized protein YdgA (DUF945 family)